ncbi:MAG: hypothetical protein JKY48_10120 [Flavobacteriales bacterium]|nr:hypothetical protein [Flavobacteriales bacterium]
MMLQKIRESFTAKVIALVMIQGLIFPSIPTARANGGPVDSNYQGGGGGELVDPSSGSFNYSIPLLDVGGFPIQLSYNAGVTMDQQASMVGLGWDLNLQAINRTVRGIPDDFDGDKIETTMNLRPQLTIHNTFSPGMEIVGADVLGDLDVTSSADINFGFTFNNYTGNENSIGTSGSVGFMDDATKGGPGAFLNSGVSSSSRSGLSTNLGVSLALGKKGQFSSSLGINRNSLYGSSLNTGFGYNKVTDVTTQEGKKTNKKVGSNVSGSFPLGMQAYTPTATFEFENKSWTMDIAAGGLTFAGMDLHGSYSRTKSTVCLKENIRTQKAYGYMNQEKGYNKNALQDFNLSLPQVHENTAGVPTPMPTNDYFTTPGGMFRAIRNDAGYVKNPRTKSVGNAGSLSGDAALGSGFELGVNISYNRNNSTSGNWVGNNPFSDAGVFEFTSETPLADAATKARYEKYTFQKVNNRSSVATTQYDGIRKEKALRQQIYKDAGEIKAHDYMASDNGDPDYDVTADSYFQNERRDRNEVLEQLNNQELIWSGENSFNNYTLNNFSFSAGNYSVIGSKSRVGYPSHHIGELTVIGSGGSKAIYGIPVMNETDQVSFNISAINNAGFSAPTIDGQGLVEYISTGANADNSLNNKRGDDHFYLKNHVPKHATSYLLTEQLSSNYTDRTGNGPTPDDYGSYTKFNYAYQGVKNWRFPYEQNKATFDEGFKSNTLDDKASYAYGERDEWYVHSIESKDYIAEFYYSKRLDARGAAGENGGVHASNYAQKVDSIKLYTRKGKEYEEGPVKTVHFKYNYSLCSGTPDNESGGGKLTLESLYFTGYDSPQGKLNKYKFTYGANANYNLGQTDRWGNYQTAPAISHTVISSLDNAEYPYTKQNKTQADLDAQKWKLSAIDLPVGSRIEIAYEAADYEYIQNYEATRMYKLEGFYSTDVEPEDVKPELVSDFGNALFDPENKDEDHFYALVDLDGTIEGTESEARVIFENQFLPQKVNSSKRYLYYNTLLNLAPHNDGIVDPDAHEYIQGYAEIIENAWYLLVWSPGVWNKVVYRIKPERLNETKAGSPKTHPMSRKAWQLVKEALPLVLYPENDLQAIYAKDGSINCGSSEELVDGGTEPDLGDDSKNHKKNIKSILSVYHMMKNTGYASRAELAKCWVRMRSGLSSKIGGGYRVKHVKTYDNWNHFVAGENSSVYGTKYDYTTTNLAGDSISSGVASFEPINRGGDEIALRHPHFYVHAQKGIPSEKFYTEFPLNEAIYASAQVRYSSVTRSSIDYLGLVINTPGYTVYKNFTAKDYPIRLDYTKVETKLDPPGAVGLLGISKNRFGISYGAAVVTNDMHGKFKSKINFSANGNEIYKMEHIYHEETPGVLANKLPTIKSDGTYEERIVGQNTDFLTFLSKSESNSSTFALKMNFEFTPTFIIIPSAWPSGNTSENTIYTTLTTKVIYQSGLLQKVMVEDNGRAKFTENLLYDSKTGAAIATEVIPEKGDGVQKIFEYSYPAHWAYENFGLASDNSGMRRFDITGAGTTILAAEKPYFFPGDELMVFEYSTGIIPIPIGYKENLWVVENENTGAYFLAKEDGSVYTPVLSEKNLFKVQYPGKRNTAGASMASVSTLKKHDGTSPYAYDPEYLHEDIINLSGIDFFEEARLNANSCLGVGNTINPYVHNLKGQWKTQNSYVFDGDRDYSASNSRRDGLLTEYQAFWRNVDGVWRKIDDPARLIDYNPGDPLQDWIKTSTATLFDAYGNGLESKNALNVYNSQDVGYNQQIQKNTTMNARHAEAGFDGFEDYFVDGIYDEPVYTPYSCNSRHFDWSLVGEISSDEAHTGNYSLLVKEQGIPTSFNSHTWDGVAPLDGVHIAPFVLQEADVIPRFRLLNDQIENKYVLTVWAKENDINKVINYDAASVEIKIGVDVLALEEKRSNIIDGWQRLEYVFNVDPALPDNTTVSIDLKAANPHGVYYDDVRIQPYDSEMKSAAIDAIKRRNMSSLDGRDFSTTYQYDENGTMVRVIQETERGKQTVKENRSGIRIND